MKKKWGVAVFFAALMMLSVVSFGATRGQAKVYLQASNSWSTGAMNVTRNTAYSTVYLKVLSVFPSDGRFDNYTKAKFRIKASGNGIVMSDTYVCSEGEEYDLKIREGYLDISTIDYQAKGNNSKLSAYTVFNYDGDRRK